MSSVDRKRYIDYLFDIVGRSDTHESLIKHLLATEFYSLVPNDDNRGIDGEQLREKFKLELGVKADPLSLPDIGCSVLEMLIALSLRIEFDLYGGPYEKDSSDWFWVLIDNLDMTRFDNFAYRKQENVELLEEKLDILLERQYDFAGFGGVFPLNNPQEDQRKVEIWYQMSSWIIENYPI